MSLANQQSSAIGALSGKTDGEHLFNPNKSAISSAAMDLWLRSPMNNDVKVPGLGDASHAALRNAGVHGVFPLLAKYLEFSGTGVSPQDSAQRFFEWLGTIPGFPATGACKHSITRSVAERLQTVFPELGYNAAIYPKR
jgi:hypothetical protein